MALPDSLLLLALLTPATISMPGQNAMPPASQPRQIPLTRTIKIPVTQLTAPGQGSGTPHSDPSALAVWPGATDELPEGPDGFDVLRDGSLVISDPLLRRVVIYNASGAFKASWPIDFSPDSITATSDDLLLVRDARTEELHVFSRDGKAHEASPPKLAPLPEANLLRGQNTGTVSAAPSTDTGARTFSVHVDQPGLALLSVQPIARDPALGTFVALETTAPETAADTINVRKVVRLYSPAGALLAETRPLPLDYFVPPVNELRVRNGIIYQLLTSRNAVLINEWDTNAK